MPLKVSWIVIVVAGLLAPAIACAQGLSAATARVGTQSASQPSTPKNSGDASPAVLNWIMPAYPEDAAKGHIEGTVVLRLSIGEDGKVGTIQVVSGPTELAAAAVSAAREWKFAPAQSDGRAVPAEKRISFRFTLLGLRTEIPGVGVVEPPILVHPVRPKYPSKAVKQRIEGTVTLRAIIGKDGSVQELRFVSGPPDLRDAAMKAVRRWRYKPGRLQGQPVEIETTISVAFRVDR